MGASRNLWEYLQQLEQSMFAMFSHPGPGLSEWFLWVYWKSLLTAFWALPKIPWALQGRLWECLGPLGPKSPQRLLGAHVACRNHLTSPT